MPTSRVAKADLSRKKIKITCQTSNTKNAGKRRGEYLQQLRILRSLCALLLALSLPVLLYLQYTRVINLNVSKQRTMVINIGFLTPTFLRLLSNYKNELFIVTGKQRVAGGVTNLVTVI